MTEQAQDVAQPVTPASQSAQADAELQKRFHDHMQQKGKMLSELVQLYSAFTQAVAKFDVPTHIKQIGLQHLDTGFLWIKEAIQVAPIPPQAIAQPQAVQDQQIDAA